MNSGGDEKHSSESVNRVTLSVGGRSLSMNVQAGNEDLAKQAANLVTERVKIYRNALRNEKDEATIALWAAFDVAIKFIHLRNSKSDCVLAPKIESLIEKIDSVLDD